MILFSFYAFLRSPLKLLLKAKMLICWLSLRAFLKFCLSLDLYGKWSYYSLCLIIILPTVSFGENIASFKKAYSNHISSIQSTDLKNLAGICERSPTEASLSGSSNLEGSVQAKLGSSDTAIQFMNETTKDRPYFTIGHEDPFVKGAQGAIQDPEAFLKARVFVSEDILEEEEIVCEEGRGLEKTICIEEPIIETYQPADQKTAIQASIYGSHGGLFRTDLLSGKKLDPYHVTPGGNWAAHITLPKPLAKEIAPLVKSMRIVNFSGKRARVPRWAALLAQNIYLKGYVLEFNSKAWVNLQVDIEVTYAPKPVSRIKIGAGNGCKHLHEKVQKGQCRLVATAALESPPGASPDWNRRRLTFECGRPSTCKPLQGRGCYQVGSTCKNKQGNTCVLWQQTYKCPSKKKNVVQKLQSDIHLVKNEISPYASNNGIADAVAKLQILKEVQDDIRAEQTNSLPSIFKGETDKCVIAFGNFKNCCFKQKGWGVSMNLAGCKGEEKALAQKRERELCVEIGTYCAEKLPLIGCIKKKKSYCCFPSRLSRLVHRQGRSQLGIGWGSPERPNCRGFSVAELAHIDFDKLDLSEILKDISNRVKAVDPSTLQQRLGTRIQSMTAPFKEGGQSI